MGNLVLLCSFHHHRVHEGGFTIRGSPQDGTLSFYRPDGTRIRDPRRELSRERTGGQPKRPPT